MKVIVWTLAIMLFLGIASAGQQHVSITIHEDTSVDQEVILVVDYILQANNTLRYRVPQAPKNVDFPTGQAIVNETENGTFIEITPQTITDPHTIHFTLRYGVGSLVELTGTDRRVFSQNINTKDDSATVTLFLPRGYTLVDREPAVSPEPETLSTDGKRIRMTWVRSEEDLSIIVIYRSSNNWILILSALVLLSIATFFGLRIYKKRQVRKALLNALSEDERALMKLLQEGVKKQKEISERTGWSKSKTSKLVRRLEERGVINKKPYFKTNKLSITSFWKK